MVNKYMKTLVRVCAAEGQLSGGWRCCARAYASAVVQWPRNSGGGSSSTSCSDRWRRVGYVFGSTSTVCLGRLLLQRGLLV